MHVFDEGRKAFLEFLRNLTPQVALLSLAYFIGTRLDFNRVDLSNWAATLLFFALLLLAIISVAANSINFMSDYCRSLDVLDKAVKLRISALKFEPPAIPCCGYCGLEPRPATKVGVLGLLGIALQEAAKIKVSLLAELLFTVLAVQVLMLTVFISSIFGGANLLKIAN
ncbi:hypothetical protein [Xanthomonas euvesicatoria]|uniref:hypothetical protein n=1 Tax=Xanthomonas euvesicatoria TaxID=456327 RepID=UPI0010ACF904|nr:hypothetical protein [Xanthomonas euvesicatoria]